MDSEISENEIEEEGEEEEEEEEEVRGAMLRFQQRELKRKQTEEHKAQKAEKAQKKQKVVKDKSTPAPVKAKAKAKSRIGLGPDVSTDPMGKLVGNDDYGEWRCVPGFPEDKLMVSSEGWVKVTSPGISLEHATPTKGSSDQDVRRYKVCVFQKSYFVHRLVCRAFHGPEPDYRQDVDHWDQNPWNNKASNLRWVSHQVNSNNQREVIKTNSNARPILGRRVGAKEWIPYKSAVDASKKLNLNSGNISQVVRGNYPHTGGYEFKYDDASMEPQLLDGEVWVPLWGYESSWRISNMGRVKNYILKSHWSKPRTPLPTDDVAYAMVSRHAILVHNAVFKSFKKRNIRPGYLVDHIDSNKSNNKLSNLQELTPSENVKKEYDNGRHSTNSTRNSIPMLVWDKTDTTRQNSRTYKSISDACRNENVVVQSLVYIFIQRKCNQILWRGKYWEKVFSTPAQPQPS